MSDDYTLVRRDGERLIASAPATIAGKIEVRGIGIVEVDHVADQPVALLVELRTDIERMPDEKSERAILGLTLPVVSIDALTASAAAKVTLALDRLGRTFQ